LKDILALKSSAILVEMTISWSIARILLGSKSEGGAADSALQGIANMYALIKKYSKEMNKRMFRYH
jgi:hypothetical protein